MRRLSESARLAELRSQRMLGGQPPLVESLTKSKRITIIASKMITWQELRDRLQNV
jgi:hypothetical protein